MLYWPRVDSENHPADLRRLVPSFPPGSRCDFHATLSQAARGMITREGIPPGGVPPTTVATAPFSSKKRWSWALARQLQRFNRSLHDTAPTLQNATAGQWTTPRPDALKQGLAWQFALILENPAEGTWFAEEADMKSNSLLPPVEDYFERPVCTDDGADLAYQNFVSQRTDSSDDFVHCLEAHAWLQRVRSTGSTVNV